MDDLPVFKKCCFCVPLRYGLLTWGYIKLGLAVLAGSFYIVTLAAVGCYIQGIAILAGSLYIIILTAVGRYARVHNLLATIFALIGMLLATEIIIHIVFIIGAHKKKVKLLKIYYYYAIFIWVAIIVISIIGIIFLTLAMWASKSADRTFIAILFSFSCFCIIFAIGEQTFLLLSVRSEIIKLRSNCPYRFVKNDNEPEGTINSVKDEGEMAIDNGTVRIL